MRLYRKLGPITFLTETDSLEIFSANSNILVLQFKIRPDSMDILLRLAGYYQRQCKSPQALQIYEEVGKPEALVLTCAKRVSLLDISTEEFCRLIIDSTTNILQLASETPDREGEIHINNVFQINGILKLIYLPLYKSQNSTSKTLVSKFIQFIQFIPNHKEVSQQLLIKKLKKCSTLAEICDETRYFVNVYSSKQTTNQTSQINICARPEKKIRIPISLCRAVDNQRTPKQRTSRNGNLFNTGSQHSSLKHSLSGTKRGLNYPLAKGKNSCTARPEGSKAGSLHKNASFSFSARVVNSKGCRSLHRSPQKSLIEKTSAKQSLLKWRENINKIELQQNQKLSSIDKIYKEENKIENKLHDNQPIVSTPVVNSSKQGGKLKISSEALLKMMREATATKDEILEAIEELPQQSLTCIASQSSFFKPVKTSLEVQDDQIQMIDLNETKKDLQPPFRPFGQIQNRTVDKFKKTPTAISVSFSLQNMKDEKVKQKQVKNVTRDMIETINFKQNFAEMTQGGKCASAQKSILQKDGSLKGKVRQRKLEQIQKRRQVIDLIGLAVAQTPNHLQGFEDIFWQLPMYFLYRRFFVLRSKLLEEVVKSETCAKIKVIQDEIRKQNAQIQVCLKKMMKKVAKKLKLENPDTLKSLQPYLTLDFSLNCDSITNKFFKSYLRSLVEATKLSKDLIPHQIEVIDAYLIGRNHEIRLEERMGAERNKIKADEYYKDQLYIVCKLLE